MVLDVGFAVAEGVVAEVVVIPGTDILILQVYSILVCVTLWYCETKRAKTTGARKDRDSDIEADEERQNN